MKRRKGAQTTVATRVLRNEPCASSSSSSRAENNSVEMPVEQQCRNNPLLNPVVLSTLFEVCKGGRAELQNYRLVCKTWYKESLPRWRKSMRLRVEEDFDYFEGIKPYKTRSKKKESSYRDLTMDDLIVLANEGTNVEYGFRINHFRAFSIRLYSMTLEDCFKFTQFWDICSVWMHELRLCGNAKLNYFEEIQRFVPERLPNLNSMLLGIECEAEFPFRGQPDYKDEHEEDYVPAKCHKNMTNLKIYYSSKFSFPSSWIKFFRHFPNIRGISLVFDQWRSDTFKYEGIAKLLQAIQHIRKSDKDKLCIKRFKIGDGSCRNSEERITDGVISLFSKLNLPLETLELELENETPAAAVEKMIHCHSSTLKSLTLFRGRSETAFPDFPFGIHLDSLTKLKLCGVMVPNLAFLRYTPNLQELYMSLYTGVLIYETGGRVYGFLEGNHDFISETNKYCDMSSVELVHMKILQLRFRINDPTSMQSVTSWMPNVEDYEGEVKAGSFSVMCEKWKHSLRRLKLTMWSDIDDEVITGIPQKSKKSQKGALAVSKGNKNGNIASLQNLQVFETHQPMVIFKDNVCTHELLNITNYSFKEGFLKLPCLRELSMWMSEEMNAATKAELEKRHVNSDISVTDSCACGHFEPRLTRTRKPISYKTGYWNWDSEME